nr:solute carrier family 41 member 1-like [Drosophila suzukii]
MAKASEPQVPKTHPDIHLERWYCTLFQIAIPFFLAGVGTITAGLMLVATLCGLKGNLDMCVASRISTHSNLGHLSTRKAVLKIIIGNMALVQLQAIACAILLSALTVGISVISNHNFSLKDYPVPTAAALITSSTSCFLLDSIVMAAILFSQRFSFNPDYMAIPIVASLGDIVTIGLLSFSAATMYDVSKSNLWISICVVVGYLVIMLPIWLLVVIPNVYVRPILLVSWKPVITALCISQIAGFVLSSSVHGFRAFAIFSPIINGIGGNLVSVEASHMSSVLYQRSILGVLPEDSRIVSSLEAPLTPFPGNVVLVILDDYLYMSHISVRWTFVVAFVLTSLLQLLMLLWLAHALVHLLWRRKIDPDSAAIPYLTAVRDSLSTSLLAAMFHLLRRAKEEYETRNRPWFLSSKP